MRESLMGQMAPEGSTLKDVQVGGDYFFIVKDGKKFLVKTTRSRDIGQDRTFSPRTVLSTTDEKKAFKKFYSLWKSAVDDVENVKMGVPKIKDRPKQLFKEN
jgi:hypothetical protein